MSKGRLSNSRRRNSGRSVKPESSHVKQYLGLSLSGGKADKACVAVLDYYPEHKKLFLTKVVEKIKTEEFISADLKIHEILTQYERNLDMIGVDAPLSLPKCLTCKLTCPGYENCHEPEIDWLREFYNQINKGKKPRKTFTPYTQRCIDAFLSQGLEEKFEVHHALGANLAPMTTRAHFIIRRIESACVEVQPKISVFRLGKELKIMKSQLKAHKHSVSGEESRRALVQALVDRRGLFLYEQDRKLVIENSHAFEAFICAYTAFLFKQGQTQERPKTLPKSEPWIAIPR